MIWYFLDHLDIFRYTYFMALLLPRLNKGDKIGVWTASDPISGTQAEHWVQRGKKILESMGYSILEGKTLTAKTHYTAGTPECRWQDFLHFIKHPEIKMILTALGGENAHQILPLIDFELISRHPKIIMGYSDPTVFLNPIASLSKVPTFYGPHLASFDPEWPWFGDYDKKCFEQIFLKAQTPFDIPPSDLRQCWREGLAEGHLIGGSLTDLRKLLATPFEPVWDGAILILETMKQTSQNVDVYLTHLLQAGVFMRISGLILGKFYECGDPQLLKKIIMDILSPYNFPILKTVDFGHFSHFCPLPLGGKIKMNAREKSFQITEPLFKEN